MAYFVTEDSVIRFSEQAFIDFKFSRELAEIAQGFADLQDARHLADYDVVDAEGVVGFSWASDCIDQARHMFEVWDRVKSSDEASVFLASILFSEKWRRKK